MFSDDGFVRTLLTDILGEQIVMKRACMHDDCDNDAMVLFECEIDGCCFFCFDHAIEGKELEKTLLEISPHRHTWYTLVPQ